MSTDLTPMRIDGEAVTTDEDAPVLSPYDGHEIGRVPVGTAADIDRAVAVARARHRDGAMPAHRRAEILDEEGQGLLYSNPIYLLPEGAEAPAHRLPRP